MCAHFYDFEVILMAAFFTPIEPITPMSFDKISPIAPMTFDKASPVSSVDGSDTSAIPFADVLKEAVSNYASISEVTAAEGEALALGDVDNLAQLQIDSMKAQAALSTTVQLTSRAVSAYKEIMQMQI